MFETRNIKQISRNVFCLTLGRTPAQFEALPNIMIQLENPDSNWIRVQSFKERSDYAVGLYNGSHFSKFLGFSLRKFSVGFLSNDECDSEE